MKWRGFPQLRGETRSAVIELFHSSNSKSPDRVHEASGRFGVLFIRRKLNKDDWFFFPADGDRGGLRIGLVHDNRVITAVRFVIIHAPLDILRVDAFGREKILTEVDIQKTCCRGCSFS